MVFIVEMVSDAPSDVRYPDGSEMGHQFQCHDQIWRELMALGLRYGWLPAGTVPDEESSKRWRPGPFEPDYEPVDWSYLKRVTAGDALAWAAALERGLGEDRLANEAEYPRPTLVREDMTASEYDSANRGLSSDLVREFIAFLRKGSFIFTYDD